MKKLIVLSSLLLLGASFSYAGSWGLSASNGTGPFSGSVTVPTAGTYVIQAYAYNSYAVASFNGNQVMDYNGYTGSQYQTGSIVAGTYSGQVSTTSGFNSISSATVSVTW